jgi:signal transduction histidine kinase/DNA-binding response OmpR family regulator/ligand-binding sensor domain-containing protein
MQKRIIIPVLLIFSLLFVRAQNENNSFINYSLKDGLSQNGVNCIIMDSRNYIWIGTNHGINRFNGRTFDQIKPKDDKYKNLHYQNIQDIQEDKKGFLWILSENKIYLFDYIKNEIKEFSGQFTSLKINVTGNIFATSTLGLEQFSEQIDGFICIEPRLKGCIIQESSANSIYLTDNKSIYSFDIRTKQPIRYNNPQGIQNLATVSLFLDWDMTLWILTNTKGCFQLKKGSSIISKWEDTNLDKIITGFGSYVTGDRNFIYFATAYNGIVIYNPLQKSIENIYNQNLYNLSISNNNARMIYLDKFGGMWVGTNSCGVDYLSKHNNRFKLINRVTGLNRGLGTSGAFEEFYDNLYVGTEGGLTKVSKRNYVASAVEIKNTPKNTFDKTGVKYIKKVDESHLWLAPFMRGLHLFNVNTNRIEKSINNNMLYDVKKILIDKNKRTWIASLNGLGYIDWDDDEIIIDKNLQTQLKGEVLACIDMISDKQGQLIIASRNKGIIFYDTQKQKLIQWDSQNTPWLPENYIIALMIDSDNQLWIATNSSGVICYNMVSGHSKTYNQSNGLPSNYIYALAEDKEHNIWCTSSGGITRINSDKKLQNYTKKNGYPIEEPYFGSLFYSSYGDLWIGGNNGFAVFRPTSLKTNIVKPNLEFCHITFPNFPEEEAAINEKTRDISLKEYSVTLKHNCFPVVIDFNAINYTYPEMNKYAYRITGVFDEWKDIGNNGNISIPTLQSGSYTFQVKASNNDNIWNEEGIILNIEVLPPFWLSWWAYLIYISIIIFIIYNFIRYYKIKTDFENDIKIKLIEKKNSEQAFEDKLKLYTNFSHELRTPLTLITGPVNELIEDTANNKRQVHLLELVRKNTNRLLFLVNQLMDYRKIDVGNFNLYKRNSDLNDLINNVISAFNQLAESKNIKIDFTKYDDNLIFAYDESLIESLLYNLLSNAFKFTGDNGRIEVFVDLIGYNDVESEYRQELPSSLNNEFVRILVSDSGIGIAPENIVNIFTRFYQVETGEHRNAPIGTGIGLHLCQNIVKLHQGIIFASSEIGKGATFTVLLPYDKSMINQFELTKRLDETENNLHPAIIGEVDSQVIVEGAFTILVVEDNKDIRSYICEHLEKNYTVLVADNGSQALEIIDKNDISLIISDVMMPVMDGIELCSAIKNNIETSHIPVILLTARTAEEHIIEGYQIQADDYILKPFNVNVLCARADNLIRKQLLLSEANGRTLEIREIDPLLMTLDDKFLQKTYKYIEDNISEPNLDLDRLSKEIGVSKGHLNRKIKALTTLTPARLILKQRFKRAEKLIDKGEKSITELAYGCGFSDVFYFSRCFKQEYKQSPSDYIKSKKKG